MQYITRKSGLNRGQVWFFYVSDLFKISIFLMQILSFLLTKRISDKWILPLVTLVFPMIKQLILMPVVKLTFSRVQKHIVSHLELQLSSDHGFALRDHHPHSFLLVSFLPWALLQASATTAAPEETGLCPWLISITLMSKLLYFMRISPKYFRAVDAFLVSNDISFHVRLY